MAFLAAIYNLIIYTINEIPIFWLSFSTTTVSYFCRTTS